MHLSLLNSRLRQQKFNDALTAGATASMLTYVDKRLLNVSLDEEKMTGSWIDTNQPLSMVLLRQLAPAPYGSYVPTDFEVYHYCR